tara:strand:+ start:7419 stop:8327 length:909 start_codon:yes stop_codon:yes gene_type:complete
MVVAPVILFTFNRPIHTKKTLEALLKNDLVAETKLYVFSDGPRNEKDFLKIKEVRKLLYFFKSQKNFLEFNIIESEINKGLADSVINGISKVFKEFNSVIVLEDDLIVSNDYIKYMNEALQFYKNTNAGSVTGYNPLKLDDSTHSYRAYSMPRSCSFGWGTWKNIWNEIDWEAKEYNNFRKNFFKRREFNKSGFDRSIRLDRQMKTNVQSWSIRFGFNLFMMNKLTYYPVNSKIKPNGWDGSGTHVTSGVKKFNLETKECVSNVFKTLEVDYSLLKRFQKLYGNGIKDEVRELFYFVKNLIH